MSNPEFSSKKPEQLTPEQIEQIYSALNSLAVAVSSLGSELLLGEVEAGPAAFLKYTSEKGLTVRYKPGEGGLVYQNQAPSDETRSPALATVAATVVPQNADISTPETENQRVKLSGRLGTEVRYQSRKDGGVVARFALGVPIEGQENGKTWYDIVAFKKAAEQVQNHALVKGQWVDVMGFAHPKKPKTGKSKPGKEIYAFMVKPADKSGRK